MDYIKFSKDYCISCMVKIVSSVRLAIVRRPVWMSTLSRCSVREDACASRTHDTWQM